MPAKIKLDWKIIDGFLSYGATFKMCADVMGISVDTIERGIKKEKGMGPKEYKDSKLSLVKTKLIQKAIRMALDGNVVMLIFCLKNLCAWTDKNVDVKDVAQQIMLNYKLDDDGNLNSKPK